MMIHFITSAESLSNLKACSPEDRSFHPQISTHKSPEVKAILLLTETLFITAKVGALYSCSGNMDCYKSEFTTITRICVCCY